MPMIQPELTQTEITALMKACDITIDVLESARIKLREGAVAGRSIQIPILKEALEVAQPKNVNPTLAIAEVAEPVSPVVPVTQKSPEKAISEDPGEISMKGLGGTPPPAVAPKGASGPAMPLTKPITEMVTDFKRKYPEFQDKAIPMKTWSADNTPKQLMRPPTISVTIPKELISRTIEVGMEGQ